MGTAYLVNTVRVGSTTKNAGQLIDSAQEDVAAITAAGGLLVSTTAPEVIAAAALALKELRRGGSPHELTAMMTAGMMAALFNGNLELRYATLANITDRPVYREGRVYYSDNALNIMTEFPDVTLQAGEEQQAPAVNDTSSTITNGMVVYAYGPQGQRLAVRPASTALADTYRTRIIGLATHDIAAHQNGRITTFGLVHDMDTSALTAGADCYISASPGVLSKTPSNGTTVCCRVGLVMNKHPNTGSVFVFPITMPRLAGTTPNRPSSPRTGEAFFDTSLALPIWWNGSAWVNASGAGV